MRQHCVPAVSPFTSSSLRNRVRVHLNAPASQILGLLGEASASPSLRVEDGGVLHELVRLYAPGVRYTIGTDTGGGFGATNNLSFVTIEPTSDGTILTWDQHHDGRELDARRTQVETALADIVGCLIRHFGGTVLEHSVDRPTSNQSTARPTRSPERRALA